MHIRVYTQARRLRTYVGKFPDGTAIPGGPFNIPQMVAAFVVLVVVAELGAAVSWWSLLLLLPGGGAVIALSQIPDTQAPLTAMLLGEIQMQIRRRLGPTTASAVPVESARQGGPIALVDATDVPIGHFDDTTANTRATTSRPTIRK